LQVKNSIDGEPKLWIESTSRELKLGDFGKKNILEGGVDLVIRGGICVAQKGLGLYHLDLNKLKVGLGFPLDRGFFLTECLYLVFLVILIFIHINW